jgi:transcriptional regulator with XRE-family HTH domain
MKPRKDSKTGKPLSKRQSEAGADFARIQEFLKRTGKRVELAAKLGVSESRISEYVSGKRNPTAEGWIALGKLALEYGLSNPFFFWAQASIDPQTLRSMADRIVEGQRRLMGETVPVPRFWETESGRKESGPPVPLPTEFMPNPESTICLLVDQRSDGIVDSPRGLVILDTSCQGVDDLEPLWDRVVVLRYAPTGERLAEKGLYAGRLRLAENARTWREPNAPVFVGLLEMIGELRGTNIGIVRNLPLGTYTDSEGMRGIPTGDEEGRTHRWKEIQGRARSRFRLAEGTRVLGKVIGRLTGHLTE